MKTAPSGPNLTPCTERGGERPCLCAEHVEEAPPEITIERPDGSIADYRRHAILKPGGHVWMWLPAYVGTSRRW